MAVPITDKWARNSHPQQNNCKTSSAPAEDEGTDGERMSVRRDGGRREDGGAQRVDPRQHEQRNI